MGFTSFNLEAEKGKRLFDNLIKNENDGVEINSEEYDTTRTIYTLNDSGTGLLLYHYYGLLNKLYQYRKKKMEVYDNLVIGADFDVKRHVSNNYYQDLIIYADNISSIISYDNSKGYFIQNKKLLEEFYQGSLKNGLYRFFTYSKRTFDNDANGFRAYFPHKFKAIRFYDHYSTNQVIRVPDSVRTLEYLVNGDLNKYISSSSVSAEQLECFDFDDEPYDEIGLDFLDEIYGILNEKKVLASSKEGIIDYAINQAEANAEIMRLVKERR